MSRFHIAADVNVRFPRPLAAFAALLGIAITVALLAFAATPARATLNAITVADSLEWGFKLSWRQYAGLAELSGGAAQLPEASAAGYDVGWAFEGGSYDDETRTTILEYHGSARWHSHSAAEMGLTPPPGYSGPLDVDLLDLTMSDPIVTISAERATISAEVLSRDFSTWQVVDYGRIDVVDLALDGVVPTVADGTTTWSGLPATMNAQASIPFGETYYPVGIQVDAGGFSYAGPGGAPDLSEHFDAEGQIKLAPQGENVLLTPQIPIGNFETFAVDPGRRLAHTRLYSPADDTYTYRAFDLETMQAVGEPLVLPWDSFKFVMLNDTISGRIYASTANYSYPRAWLRYDTEAGEYVQGEDAEAIATSVDNATLTWDPVGERAFEVVLHRPEGADPQDFDAHQWQLRTYVRQPDETWQLRTYDLPNGPAHLNASRYRRLGVAAADGSLIVLGDRWFSRPAGAVVPPTQVPGAYRVVTHEDGSAEVEPITGSEILNQGGKAFSLALAADDGTVGLVTINAGGTVQRFDVTPTGGGPIAAESAVDLGFPSSDIGPKGVAIDPENGTVWVGGTKSKRIVGVRDGGLVAEQTFALRNTRAGELVAGPDHELVMQSNDGSDASLTQTAYGFQKLVPIGVTPRVSGDPSGQEVALGSGQETAPVSFAARASGDPVPQSQWQVKAPGALRFKDLVGETGETLSVEARRGMDGTQYRAVFENAAGRVASEVATLAVDYAPRIISDLANRGVTEGADALFLLGADGNPEPTVTWQRRVGGFWQTIAPEDDSFILNASALTVLETNAEQSGALFRAKLSNSVASVFSRTAKLTVTPKTTIPPEGLDLENVSLEWSGNEEMQKAPPFGDSNYLSAGVSNGKEATYDAFAANAAVYQVSPSGTETIATWATRAAHVSNGGHQLARLHGGEAKIEPDGQTTVQWDGGFSVNFYGGLAPFTFTDPELEIDASGAGTLSAEMSGCESSQANPNQCTPFAAVPDVTVATFSQVEVDPTGAVAITPDYAGVEVTVPSPSTPQNRAAAGWGAWPQPFVDFHLKTGLSSYWYSSGGTFDPYKPPSPFTVDFAGEALPAEPTPEPSQPSAQPGPQGGSVPNAEVARIAGAGRTQALGGRRIATVATLTCLGEGFCAVLAPRRVRLRIAGERRWARVIAPRILEEGAEGAIEVRLSKAALAELGGGTATGRLSVSVRSRIGALRRVVTVRIEHADGSA